MKVYWAIFKPKTQGTKVIIKNGQKILFVTNTYRNSFWTLPGGGVKKEEAPEAAAIRECWEELRIKIIKIKNHGNFLYTKEGKEDTVWVLSTNIKNSKFEIDQKEVDNAKWIEIRKIKSINPTPVVTKSLKLAKINF